MNTKRYQQFEDLIVWQEAINLCVDLYRYFRDSREYSLKDQIIRSAVSIPSNIAEGFERQSEKEFVKFLFYAKGSSGELRTQLNIASQLKIIDPSIYIASNTKSRRISGMLQNLITTIQKDIHANNKAT